MKYLITNKQLNPEKIPFSEEKVYEVFKQGFWIYYEAANPIVFDDILAFRDGYIFDLSEGFQSYKEKEISALRGITKEWPVKNHITGSFAVTVIQEKTITICNDCIGVYPIYYYQGDEFIISSDIYWMAHGIKNFELDDVGITQKLIGYESVNIGSRTILNNVKRLLPGELINFPMDNLSQFEKLYDNTLFNINDQYDLTGSSLKDYWEQYYNEVKTLLDTDKNPFLALSGGMDSRVLLGSIPTKTKLTCLTYGAEDSYEVKVAKKLSKIKKFEFNSFHDYQLYFPKKDVLSKYIKQSESLRIPNWLEILENVSPNKDSYILLGDMCEALPARNVKKYITKESRIKSFIQHNVLRKDYRFTKSNKAEFKKWKQTIIDELLLIYSKKKIEKLNLSYDTIIAEVKKDYQEIIDRIYAHQIEYSELYSELFAWYTHSRVSMGQQILTCNSMFKSICPPMSINILRMTSSIHPKYRLGYRFMNKLFRKIPLLKELNSIPTSQSPLVNRKLPSILVFFSWALRSKIDQFFIKRLMKRKNPNMRYRLFKGLNWVKIYQQKDNLKNVESYFSEPNLIPSSEKNGAIEKLKGRKTLESWPFTNFDIMGTASIQIQLELMDSIRKNKKQQ